MFENFDYDRDKFYDALTASTDDYIYINHIVSDVTKISKTMEYDFDMPGQYIQNFSEVWIQKIHPDDRDAFVNDVGGLLSGVKTWHDMEYRALNRFGEWVWLRCRGSIENDESGNPIIFAGLINDISKRNRVDAITGLLNKYEFEKQIKSAILERKNFSMVILNIDNFRNINDLYDREFGDGILRIIGQNLYQLIRNFENSVVYRLDGDEFGILTKVTDETIVEQIFDTTRNNFAVHQYYKGEKYHCSFSAGCYICKNIDDNYQSAMKKTNKALAYSKENGKDKLTFYSQKIISNKIRELELMEYLHESVHNNFENFEVFYQPQVVAETGKLKGAEALLRWECAKYGSVSPVEFIPILEKTNLIIPVGRWVYEQSIKQTAQWIKKFPDFRISINISYIQLFDSGFFDFVCEIADAQKVPYNNIIIELTESRFVSDKEMLNEAFKKIRKLGMNIAIDDFGTGYSSLEILKEVPADIVKVDKAFIKNISQSNFDRIFIKYIVELCHNVNLRVCLEGIEQESEMDIVSEMNLDYIQGYLYGKPHNADEFKMKFLD